MRSPTRSPDCRRSSSGHAALRELFTGFSALAAWIRVDDVRFHATADPDVAFVEEHMTAELHDGTRYENDLCLRVELPRRPHRLDLRVLRPARPRAAR